MLSLVALIVGGVMAYFVHTDSQDRGMNQVLWTVLTLFFGLLGLIAYFIARKPKGAGNDSDLLDDDMFD